jgi:uncharacterized damage-inducible protein DinB
MRIPLILRQLDQAYDRKSWHGTNLRGALRAVDAEAATWRPNAGRHNIAEIAVHAAYWKYSVLRRLIELPKGSFPLEGSDWFDRSTLTPEAWKHDLALLGDMHQRLRAAVEALPEENLDRVPPGSKTTYLDLLLGVAAHDLYHAGQIQLLKRLRQAGA